MSWVARADYLERKKEAALLEFGEAAAYLAQAPVERLSGGAMEMAAQGDEKLWQAIAFCRGWEWA